MTSTADSLGATLTTVAADILTVPAGKAAHILGIVAANVDGANPADVTVQWTDASAADQITRLAFNLAVDAGDSRSCLAAPVALREGDKVQALASADLDLELTITFYYEDAA